MRKFLFVLMGCLLGASSAMAQAQELDFHPKGEQPDGNRGNVGVELALGGGGGGNDTSVFGYAPRIFGTYHLNENIILDASINTAGASISGGGTSQGAFRIANPYIGGNWMMRVSNMWLSVGAGIALPVASYRNDTIINSFSDITALYTASAMHGLWDMHLWSAKTFSIVVPGHLTMPIGQFFLDGDAALILMIPTSGVVADKTELVLQAAATLRYPLSEMFDVGARLQAVWFLNGDGDNFQAAINPFVRIHNNQYFGQAGLMFNLDNPVGPSFTSGHTVGFLFSAGIHY